MAVSTAREIPRKTTADEKVYEVRFLQALSRTETLVSGSVVISQYRAGTYGPTGDYAPIDPPTTTDQLTIGPYDVGGTGVHQNKSVLVRIAGGVEGTRYQLLVTAQTSTGEIQSAKLFLEVR